MHVSVIDSATYLNSILHLHPGIAGELDMFPSHSYGTQATRYLVFNQLGDMRPQYELSIQLKKNDNTSPDQNLDLIHPKNYL